MGKEFLMVGEQYLNASKLLLDGMAESKNPWVVTSNSPISESKYSNKTAYSDFSIILPTLFNFYHGIELIMKGIIRLNNRNENFKHNHPFEELFKKLKVADKLNGSEYVITIGKYIEKPIKPSFLNDYLLVENINRISDLYESFRYPGNSIKLNNYFILKFNEELIIQDIIEMSRDIDIILKGAVKVFRDYEETTLLT